ncbi:hypothetical protein Trydic_g404 [Trypoxylus dichotomus]
MQALFAVVEFYGAAKQEKIVEEMFNFQPSKLLLSLTLKSVTKLQTTPKAIERVTLRVNLIDKITNHEIRQRHGKSGEVDKSHSQMKT